jgi:hypothetical protein
MVAQPPSLRQWTSSNPKTQKHRERARSKRRGTSPGKWRGLRVGLFEEVRFESGQELTARDGQKRLERGAGVGSIEESK